VREVREGRGTSHGGVFLDISWIKNRMSAAPDHIKRKLPSMYHQFKQLADIDITREPMEVGPTTHYIMGGVRVQPETQMSDIPGLFAAGECAAGLHGANRLGGNSLSDLLVFGKRAGEAAATFAKSNESAALNMTQIEATATAAIGSFGRKGESPYQVQEDLQRMMQDLVGIVRRADEMKRALEQLHHLAERARTVGVVGNREYNNGWHTALDLPNLLTVSELITRAALAREESRGAHFRDDFPLKDEARGRCNIVMRSSDSGEPQVIRETLTELPPELKQIIEEMK
jgi:succinate dehydrogenase / fumarate reductase flavoprotein subunit